MYEHRQNASILLVLLVIGSLPPLGLLLLLPAEPGVVVGRVIATLIVLIVLACAVVFSSMTVSTAAGALSWWFGPGFFRKSVPLSQIEHVEPTRTSPGEGWGIHRTERGWLYNVSGREAVCIRLEGGEQFLLGTDEPEKLVLAIEARRSHSRPS